MPDFRFSYALQSIPGRFYCYSKPYTYLYRYSAQVVACTVYMYSGAIFNNDMCRVDD